MLYGDPADFTQAKERATVQDRIVELISDVNLHNQMISLRPENSKRLDLPTCQPRTAVFRNSCTVQAAADSKLQDVVSGNRRLLGRRCEASHLQVKSRCAQQS